MIINDKLKISLDHSIYFKNDEGICSWNNAKSIRRGDFLLNDKLEYEEVFKIKKIKEREEVICTSIADKTFFAEGYLIHNTSACDACTNCSVYYGSLGTMGFHHYFWDNPERMTAEGAPNSNSLPRCRKNSNAPYLSGPAAD